LVYWAFSVTHKTFYNISNPGGSEVIVQALYIYCASAFQPVKVKKWPSWRPAKIRGGGHGPLCPCTICLWILASIRFCHCRGHRLSGATRVGVIRAATDGCHPVFFLE